MDIILKLADELDVAKWQVEAAVNLIDEGNTIPFISRYRKEVTGSLDDVQLRDLYERLDYLRRFEERKEAIRESIEEQGKLTDEITALKTDIAAMEAEQATAQTHIEDLRSLQTAMEGDREKKLLLKEAMESESARLEQEIEDLGSLHCIFGTSLDKSSGLGIHGCLPHHLRLVLTQTF